MVWKKPLCSTVHPQRQCVHPLVLVFFSRRKQDGCHLFITSGCFMMLPNQQTPINFYDRRSGKAYQVASRVPRRCIMCPMFSACRILSEGPSRRRLRDGATASSRNGAGDPGSGDFAQHISTNHQQRPRMYEHKIFDRLPLR